MNQILFIMLASWLAGLTAFIGGIFARIEGTDETESKREMVHGIVAFGGGILVAAVAFALAPEGIRVLSPLVLAVIFCSGGVAFCFLDIQLSRKGGAVAQFMAMLMDFIPEAISLGAVFGHDRKLGLLLAMFIGAQNLPEGFNSYREIVARGAKPKVALSALLAISFLGPLAALMGYLYLQGHDNWIAGIMSFASGGILYLVFQDIAPQARMPRHWTPPLGAVLGFVVGMIGRQVIG